MLKGEVHERFTETFLLGLKQGFIDASIKTVSTQLRDVCDLFVPPAHITSYPVDELADDCGGKYVLPCRRTCYRSGSKSRTVLRHVIPQSPENGQPDQKDHRTTVSGNSGYNHLEHLRPAAVTVTYTMEHASR